MTTLASTAYARARALRCPGAAARGVHRQRTRSVCRWCTPRSSTRSRMSRAHTPSSTAKRCSSTGAVCLPLYFLQPCCLHPRASQRPSVPHHTARTSATCVSTLLNWPTRNKVPLKSALTPQQRVFKHAPGAQCLQDHLFDSLQDLLATVIRAEGGDRAVLMREFVCKVDEVSVTLRKHLRKEEEQLFPLVLSHFSFDEQAELVVRARPPCLRPCRRSKPRRQRCRRRHRACAARKHARRAGLCRPQQRPRASALLRKAAEVSPVRHCRFSSCAASPCCPSSTS